MHDVFMENARITYMETANDWVGQIRCGSPHSIIVWAMAHPVPPPTKWRRFIVPKKDEQINDY